MDITEALSGRAGLAGVQWLLLGEPALEALRGALNPLLDDGAAIGAITLQRAKFKPGRHLTTYYAVQLHGTGAAGAGTRLIEVSWTPPGAADRRGEMSEMLAMQAEAIERGLAAPFRALL